MAMRGGLIPSPLAGSVALHVLALVGVAALVPVTTALVPPKLVTVEIVTAEPPPPAAPVKPVQRALAAVKHALVPHRSTKVVPTPAPPPDPTPQPVPKTEPPVA